MLLLFVLFSMVCSFKVFNNMVFKNADGSYPNYSEITGGGFHRIKLATSWAFWAPGDDIEEMPTQQRVNYSVGLMTENTDNKQIVLDIEHWITHLKSTNDEVAAPYIQRHIDIVNMFRIADKDLILGYYSVLPLREYWIPVLNESANVESWTIKNERLKPLGESVDVIYPSLYTFYDKQSKWEIYARENLKQAKFYNKPTYAYLWPKYHDSGALAGQYIPGDYWKKQLELCYEYADGIVLWSHPSDGVWNESQGWWIETKAFLERLRCNGLIKDACSNNGECRDNVCICYNGWTGSNCEVLTGSSASVIGPILMLWTFVFWLFLRELFHLE